MSGLLNLMSGCRNGCQFNCATTVKHCHRERDRRFHKEARPKSHRPKDQLATIWKPLQEKYLLRGRLLVIAGGCSYGEIDCSSPIHAGRETD